VTTPGGTGTGCASAYVKPAAPTVTIAPTSGTTLGGTSVTITGTKFTGATFGDPRRHRVDQRDGGQCHDHYRGHSGARCWSRRCRGDHAGRNRDRVGLVHLRDSRIFATGPKLVGTGVVERKAGFFFGFRCEPHHILTPAGAL